MLMCVLMLIRHNLLNYVFLMAGLKSLTIIHHGETFKHVGCEGSQRGSMSTFMKKYLA